MPLEYILLLIKKIKILIHQEIIFRKNKIEFLECNFLFEYIFLFYNNYEIFNLPIRLVEIHSSPRTSTPELQENKSRIRVNYITSVTILIL